MGGGKGVGGEEGSEGGATMAGGAVGCSPLLLMCIYSCPGPCGSRGCEICIVDCS